LNNYEPKKVFVKFKKPEAAKKALCCYSKHMIGQKAVTIAACSEGEVQEAKENQNKIAEAEPEVKEKPSPDVKEKLQDPKSQPQDPRSHGGTAEQPVKELPKALHPPTNCFLRKGLPVNANNRGILDFNFDVGLVPLSIHIMLGKFNKPTGDAFCEFSNEEHASWKQDITVQAVLREEKNEALGVVSA
jgi:RNA recognition motif-containing protein